MSKQVWSFGIICGNNTNYLEELICSIKTQDIENYEIILVGDSNRLSRFGDSRVSVVHFDENFRPMWITKKKNIVAKLAKYENISLHHDYVKLGDGWYKHFVDFGENWDVCMTRIEQPDGTRFRDWVTWGNPIDFVDYKDQTKTKQMYVSGSYFCVKKQFLLNNPFDERLSWGQGEDVEWSIRVRHGWNYRCNWKSKVQMCKYKERCPSNANDISLGWYSEWMKTG